MKIFFMLCPLLLIFFESQVSAQLLPPIPRFQNVIWVVFENKNYSTTIANPIFKAFADKGIQFSQMMAETHPSQGNYMAMVAGDFFGLSGLSGDRNIDLNVTHLGDLLEVKGMDWRVYAEDFPGNCFTGKTSGKYARKHVPFISFVNVQKNPKRCSQIVDFSGFQSDWSNHRLANFSMIIPNLDNDGHNTNINFAAQWFEKTFSAGIDDPRMMQDTLLIVTFDESESYLSPNQIYTTFLSPNLPEKISIKAKHNHYSLLKFLEDEWQLGNLGRNDALASVISELQAP